jgi:carbon monoxide dehydrogenase subunit G
VRLDFSGTLVVAAAIERVWERLMDPAFVADCAPGVEGVERKDATHFRVKTLLGVGSVQLRFALDVELAELTKPSFARMLVRGTAPGSALQAESTVKLESQGRELTRLDWTAGSEVRGAIASTGARLLKGTAKTLTEKFWKTFSQRAAKPAR